MSSDGCPQHLCAFEYPAECNAGTLYVNSQLTRRVIPAHIVYVRTYVYANIRNSVKRQTGKRGNGNVRASFSVRFQRSYAKRNGGTVQRFMYVHMFILTQAFMIFHRSFYPYWKWKPSEKDTCCILFIFMYTVD